MPKKPSFLERLTGSVKYRDQKNDGFLDDQQQLDDETHDAAPQGRYDSHMAAPQDWEEEGAPKEGELPVDMYQTADSIIIRALVAGVSPNDLDIAITRDMVTLKGSREEVQESPDEDYYHRELFWGSFSRTILLPEEIIIDEAEAKEKHGLLEIRLPKLDKERSARLTVKSHQMK